METKSDRARLRHLLDDGAVELMAFTSIFEPILDGGDEGEAEFADRDLGAKGFQTVSLLDPRRRAAFVLQAARRPKASGPDLRGEAIMRLLDRDERPDVRRAAAQALGGFAMTGGESADALTALLRVIDRREDVALRAAAVAALGKSLALRLEDDTEEGRSEEPGEQGVNEIIGAAVDALQKLGEPECADSLGAAFPTGELREIAATALTNKLTLARRPPKTTKDETRLAKMLGALIRADLNA
jgi:HEAT repeat protein